MKSLAKSMGVSRATLYRHGVSAPTARKPDAAVFEAVKTVMGERGLRGTTLEAVASRAGVSVVTLHRRYGDRLGLLRAFMDAIPARKAGRGLARADVRDVRSVLRGFTRLALGEFEASLAVTRAMLGDPEAAREISTTARDPARGVSAGVAAYFAKCVGAGTLCGDPGALTGSFLSTLFGFGLIVGTFQRGALTTDSSVAMIVSGFLDGALPR